MRAKRLVVQEGSQLFRVEFMKCTIGRDQQTYQMLNIGLAYYCCIGVCCGESSRLAVMIFERALIC